MNTALLTFKISLQLSSIILPCALFNFFSLLYRVPLDFTRELFLPSSVENLHVLFMAVNKPNTFMYLYRLLFIYFKWFMQKIEDISNRKGT